MFCPNCGRKVNSDSRFCDGCGSVLRQQTAETVGSANTQPQPHRGKSRLLKIALIALALLVAGIVYRISRTAEAKHDPTTASGRAPELTKADEEFDAKAGVWWVGRTPLLAEYEGQRDQNYPGLKGETFLRGPDVLEKYPAIVQALQLLRPAFNPYYVSTSIPSRAARLRDGRLLLVMSGCRPHLCDEYQAAIGMDAQSHEMFLYEHDKQEHEVPEETVLGAEKEGRNKGSPITESLPHDERFSGRSDDAVRALLQYVVYGWQAESNKVPDGSSKPTVASGTTTEPKLDAPAPRDNTDSQELISERQHLMRVLKSVEAMRTASSFLARARIYCRSQADAFPLLPSVGTVEDLESSYAQLTGQQSRPDPYVLQVWRERLSDAYRNMNVCQEAITNGWQALPTDEQERQETAEARTRITEIDQELALRK